MSVQRGTHEGRRVPDLRSTLEEETAMMRRSDVHGVDETSEGSSPTRDPPRWITGSASADPAPDGRAGSGVGRMLGDGMVAGLLGYAAVVVVVSAMDAAQGRSPFHTAALLGSWLFFGLEDPSALELWAGPVLAYNGVHLIVSLAAGMVGALLVLESERWRGFWYFALMVLVAAGTYTVVLLIGAGGEIARALDGPTVVLGTTAWLGAMTAYFWSAHRGAWQEIEADMDAEG